MKNLILALLIAYCSLGCIVVSEITDIPGCSRMESLDDACESVETDGDAFSCETNPSREILVCKALEAKPNIFCCTVQ